jgi:MoaA/NifB/PqqE/SkfB family radical SAM enzyme
MGLEELDLHVTNRCVLACRHCVFSSGERHINEMNTGEMLRLIDDFAGISSKKGTINLFGGEPLIRPDIFDMIKEAKRAGLSVGVTTCCQVPEKTIMKLLNSGIDRFTTNLDGATAKSHDWLRNAKGNFDKGIKTLRMFVSRGIYTTVNSVIHQGNIDEAAAILELCEGLGINAQAFYYFTPTGRGLGMKDKMVGPDMWLKTKSKVEDWIEKKSPGFGISWEQAYEPFCNSEKQPPWRCEKGHTRTLFIRCDGEAYSCALLDGAPCALGNARKDRLKDMLKGRDKKAFRRDRGCPALAFHVHKNLRRADPRVSTGLIGLGCPYEYRILRRENE